MMCQHYYHSLVTRAETLAIKMLSHMGEGKNG